MTNPSSPSAVAEALEQFATDTITALADMLDETGCPAMVVNEVSDEGISLSLHFGRDRAQRLIDRAALQPQSSEELVAEMKLAVAGLEKLTGEQKQQVESRTGYSINALAYLYVKAIAAIDHRSSSELVERWQPIETAPKDGSIVLLSDKEDVGIGHWKTSYPPLHYWFVANGYPNDGLSAFEPTHWMPLPNPPA